MNILRVLLLIAEIFAPFFIDAFCGHVVGMFAAIANVVGWAYFGLRLKVTLATRIIVWLVPFIFVVLVAVVEVAHLFHWRLN